MSCYVQERANKIKIAKKLWLETIDNFQIKCTIKDHAVNQFTTRLYYLTTNNLTARGVGKGPSAFEIDISACFEALEYYLSSYCFNQQPILFESPLEISNKYPMILDRCISENFMSASNQISSLPWVIYEDILTKEQHAIPLATVDLFYRANLLKHDTFDYINSSFYAASNGLASGSTYEESVIHGALELIERDAYSYFLIDTYLLNKRPLIINKKTLPDNLISLINNIEKNYKNEILIFKMPSRFGVYAYITTFLGKEFEIQSRGAGASLNSKHALERAIHELVQSYNLMSGSYVENEINIKKLANTILIKNFLEFNFDPFLKNSACINFIDNSNEIKRLTLSEYLLKLIELIYTKSSLLVNTVYQSKNGLTCSRVIIPDAEEFFLATHYLRLKPKSEMHAYIINKTGKTFSWDNFK